MRALASLLLLAPLLLGLAGCTTWPPPSGGGAAERMPLPELALGEDRAPWARLRCNLARMDQYATQAERLGRLAGQVEVARLLATRATREQVGGLPEESARTQDRLEAALARLATALGGAPGPACR